MVPCSFLSSLRYKFAYLQESIGDIISTRTVFERWMQSFPNEQAWLTYIKFEQRCGKPDNVRKLYERMIDQLPEQSVRSVPLDSLAVVHQVREVGGAERKQASLPHRLRARHDGTSPGERGRRPVCFLAGESLEDI